MAVLRHSSGRSGRQPYHPRSWAILSSSERASWRCSNWTRPCNSRNRLVTNSRLSGVRAFSRSKSVKIVWPYIHSHVVIQPGRSKMQSTCLAYRFRTCYALPRVEIQQRLPCGDAGVGKRCSDCFEVGGASALARRCTREKPILLAQRVAGSELP